MYNLGLLSKDGIMTRARVQQAILTHHHNIGNKLLIINTRTHITGSRTERTANVYNANYNYLSKDHPPAAGINAEIQLPYVQR